MAIRNKWIIGLFIIGVAMYALIHFYVLPKQAAEVENERLLQLDPLTHDFSKVLQYESLYMGNASNLGSLFGALPMGNARGQMALDSDQFKLTMNYHQDLDPKVIIYNSTAAFVLISNLEIIEFKLPFYSVVVTRDNVNQWFEEDVATFKDEEVFKSNVQIPLINNENIDAWFNSYVEEVE